MRSTNYGRNENRETQVKKLGGLFTRPNKNQKGKDWEMLCSGMISVRLQRR